GERIVYAATSDYQRVVVTAGAGGVRLFLNGNLQFHSRDEYRYHEALVHPALAAHGAPRRVLVLGGGDGMAVREALKYPSRRPGHAGRARPADDAPLRRHADAARAESRRAALAEARDRQRRRLHLARAARRALRRDRRRLPRPEQFRARQAVHDDLLSPARP